ncbi:MAG TPA: flagellar basal body L-ring protein FlgH [Thermotogota bacterium]|nr:flagellar basal body L-ring protein FlgH [Thermotogota bacterium]HRW92902.1 flagellar basal body L-ring protein FlgH [Thermotogota bacterium]
MKRTLVLLVTVLWWGTFVFSTSLWQSSGNQQFKNLFSDNKAYQVGDILTILIVESMTMNQSDQTDDKAGGLLTSTLSIIKNISNIDLSDFIPMGGEEDAQVSETANTVKSQVTAKIAAIVQEINENGNLKIMGRKEVKVGQDRRELVIEGLVRPADISAENTIDSFKIADAKLWYNGDVVFQQDPSEDNWIGFILSGLAGVIF